MIQALYVITTSMVFGCIGTSTLFGAAFILLSFRRWPNVTIRGIMVAMDKAELEAKR